MSRTTKLTKKQFIKQMLSQLEESGYVKIGDLTCDRVELFVKRGQLEAKINDCDCSVDEALFSIFTMLLSFDEPPAINGPSGSVKYTKYSKESIKPIYRIISIISPVDIKYIEQLVISDNLYGNIQTKYDKEEKIAYIPEEEFFWKRLAGFFQIYELIGQLKPKLPEEEKQRIVRQIKEIYERCMSISELGIPCEILNLKKFPTNPAIDREKEIKKLAVVLLTQEKSAMLVGPPGVGKTAIVEGLAYLIQNGKIPLALKDKKILKVSTSALISGCNIVGMLEEKVEKLLRYLEHNPDMILFIDEGHTLIGAGKGTNDNNDIANILKPYLDRGRIKMITCTTTSEYNKYIKGDESIPGQQQDPAFARRFIEVGINEPTRDTLISILRGVIDKLTIKYKVSWFDDENTSESTLLAIIGCTKKEHRDFRVSEKSNPDLSVAILDYAFAHATYEERTKIALEDIIEGIKEASSIYESVRKSYIQQLRNKIESNEKNVYSRGKVIPFRKQY